MGNIKQINIKNGTYYCFNDMINIKDFDSSLIKIDKKYYKNIGIYNIGYITIKKIDDYENINSVQLIVHLIIGINWGKQWKQVFSYLVSTDGNSISN